ncbi:MAG: RsbRD N-terminal domain-containing protein [Desulfarculus sp.]|nr:RsbRD N-terminal domain-containing protein [Desulfarculus sp.]
MSLVELLKANKSWLVEHWFDEATSIYQSETSHFLRSKKDQFANPVGSTLGQGLDEVYDHILEGLERAKVEPAVDRLVRIRAIQDFPPSQALGFILSLKHLIRERLAKELRRDPALAGELFAIDNQIDALALIAFDVYETCRERIHHLKAEEIKRLYYQAIKHSNVFCVVPGQEEPDLNPPSPAEVIKLDSKKESQT